MKPSSDPDVTDSPAARPVVACSELVSPLEVKFLAAWKRHKSAEMQAGRFTSKTATMGMALMYSRMLKAADDLAQDIEKRAND